MIFNLSGVAEAHVNQVLNFQPIRDKTGKFHASVQFFVLEIETGFKQLKAAIPRRENSGVF